MVDVTESGRWRCSRATAQRALRQRLVAARVRCFPTRRAAAEALGWSVRKQDLLESGDQIVGERDLPAIFDAFALDDDVGGSWLRLVEQSKARGWWDDFTDGELVPGAKEWAALEWGARRIGGDAADAVDFLAGTGVARALLADVDADADGNLHPCPVFRSCVSGRSAMAGSSRGQARTCWVPEGRSMPRDRGNGDRVELTPGSYRSRYVSGHATAAAASPGPPGAASAAAGAARRRGRR